MQAARQIADRPLVGGLSGSSDRPMAAEHRGSPIEADRGQAPLDLGEIANGDSAVRVAHARREPSRLNVDSGEHSLSVPSVTSRCLSPTRYREKPKAFAVSPDEMWAAGLRP